LFAGDTFEKQTLNFLVTSFYNRTNIKEPATPKKKVGSDSEGEKRKRAPSPGNSEPDKKKERETE